MSLTRYGLREWLTITLLSAALGAIAAWYGWWWLVALVALIWLSGVAFFRDPWRRVPADLPRGAMLSPADGVVSRILRVDRHAATGGPAIVVRIFLSVLDVHVNRAPCDGEVVSVAHAPGRYLDARSEESAQVNESNLVTLRLAERDGASGGETIGVRQVAGAIARRIVCPIRPGQRLRGGERFGMIKFGSTTELVLPRPDDVDVRVAEGQRVRGGVTLLAVLRPRGGDAPR
ncbi:MAG: phosphatidylserine decarboxylase [Phycisphaerales bacterium]